MIRQTDHAYFLSESVESQHDQTIRNEVQGHTHAKLFCLMCSERKQSGNELILLVALSVGVAPSKPVALQRVRAVWLRMQPTARVTHPDSSRTDTHSARLNGSVRA